MNTMGNSGATTDRGEGKTHSLQAQDRREIAVNGVREVVSFDDSAVILRTSLGTLLVQGQELKLKTLSLEGGQVAIDGHICAVVYEEPREGGLWQRLWR